IFKSHLVFSTSLIISLWDCRTGWHLKTG
uniref:Uncharacterized protein n=1 Tax=Chinchilla lanigera TaxID=34839 RepID=A0A8C2YK66_CHILA